MVLFFFMDFSAYVDDIEFLPCLQAGTFAFNLDVAKDATPNGEALRRTEKILGR
jgi:hypothetical protein